MTPNWACQEPQVSAGGAGCPKPCKPTVHPAQHPCARCSLGGGLQAALQGPALEPHWPDFSGGGPSPS